MHTIHEVSAAAGKSPKSITRHSKGIPSGAPSIKGQRQDFTLSEALCILIAIEITDRGFPRSLAQGIARTLKSDQERMIADEKHRVWFFAQPSSADSKEWTFCRTTSAAEALEVADTCEGVALFCGRRLLKRAMTKLVSAQAKADA